MNSLVLFLDTTQKSKTSDPEPSDNKSVSGHVSPLSSVSELSEVEQRVAADSVEHTPHVSLLYSLCSFGV